MCVCVRVRAAGMLAFKRPEVQSQIQQSDVVELVRTALAANPDADGLAENGQALLSSLWAAGSSSASTYSVQYSLYGTDAYMLCIQTCSMHAYIHTYMLCCICTYVALSR